jgi:general stress protein YciG
LKVNSKETQAMSQMQPENQSGNQFENQPEPPIEMPAATARPSTPRGFAAMNSERQREIASMGGKTAHQRGAAHRFTSEEARKAGRKGGETVSRDRDYMVDIGRRGGNARSVSMQLREKASA